MADMKERRKTPRKSTNSATPKPDVKAGAPRKPAANPASSGLSAEDAKQLIAEAAYYRAKRRGFEPGHELEDWVEAESEVMGRFNRQSL